MQRVEKVIAALVKIGPRHREVRDEQVASLMASIEKIGLRTPITVRQEEEAGDVFLVAGGHRLEACKRLGMEEIEAFVLECDEASARMWEIAENLHRADLTALERDHHVAEWIKLAEERAKKEGEDKLSQLATVSKGGRGNKEGVRAAARELGVDKDDAHRAVKVDSLSDEAKEVAKEIGVDNNRTVLLAAAKEKTPEKQVAVLREAKKKRETKRRVKETVKQLAKPREEAKGGVASSVVEVFRDLWDASDEDGKRTLYDILSASDEDLRTIRDIMQRHAEKRGWK